MTRRCWLSCASRRKAPDTSPRSARDRWCWARPACSKAIARRRTGRRWIFSAAFGATPTKTRVCVDRNRITGGGVTAGIDFALTLVVACWSTAETAEAIQLRLEYNPAPPFNAGSPDTAPAEILALMKERIAPAQARRSEMIDRAAARGVTARRPLTATRDNERGKRQEKGRLVSQTAFPVLRQPHISGRFQNICTRGLSPGRILLGSRCSSGQSRSGARHRRDGLPSP